MPGIGLECFGMVEHPFDPFPGYAISSPAVGSDHPVVHEFPDVLGNRLRGHSQFLGDLLLADSRLVLCDLDKNLEPGDLPFAARI